MKKIILALMILIISFGMNVQAEECSDWEIEEANEALKDLTFDIQYADDYTDMNGDFQEGYFKITFPNLPQDYNIQIFLGEKFHTLENFSESVSLTGGVYKVHIYKSSCDSLVKSFEIKIPFYKYYCQLENKCDDDIWFDGTYPNSDKIEEGIKNNNVRLTLIIILTILVLVLVFVIFIIIKRRRKNADSF